MSGRGSSSSSCTPSIAPFLPMTLDEVRQRGWLPGPGDPWREGEHGVDFVLVTGDAYVDHPSFANAVIGRLLEARGFRVAILAQPDWQSAEPFRIFGRPRVAWLVSAGNLDSLLNHYTAHKRPRSDDSYSPGGRAGRRPEYATVVYSQRCRQAYRDVPIIAGGVEVSMRRLAHFDYWHEKVRRSLILDARADLVVYGMGERPLVDVLERHARGTPIAEIRDVPGTAYAIGKHGRPHFFPEEEFAAGLPWYEQADSLLSRLRPRPGTELRPGEGVLELPSYDEVRGVDDHSKERFARAQHIFHREHNPDRAPVLVQRHGEQTVVINPPAHPLTTEELDAVFALPYNKAPHPSYGGERIPAFETVQFSVNVMRGCFGGCTFCAITEHQGKRISSRSAESVKREVEDLQRLDGYKGVISDLGGPTANMYRMTCSRPEIEARCRRPSCVHPTVCRLLKTDHSPIKELMREVREAEGVKKVLIASGIRMDLATLDPDYIEELATHHVGGHLKVAPEHVDDETLQLMKKPGMDVYLDFEKQFKDASRKAGKEQYLVPYLMSSHPGCDMKSAVTMAEFLKARNLKPQQVQDFIPTPGTPATCMWWTGIDPHTMKRVHTTTRLRDKRKQKALLQAWKPENETLVREALVEAGRTDLIGGHSAALLPGGGRSAGASSPRGGGERRSRGRRRRR
ncbi:MAG: YgiQ family radical SAM protein [Planctomycetota bacterium]|jgi:uncharacterized radical SAM protein YgiQ